MAKDVQLCPVCRRAFIDFAVIDGDPTYIHKRIKSRDGTELTACTVSRGDVLRGIDMRPENRIGRFVIDE